MQRVPAKRPWILCSTAAALLAPAPLWAQAFPSKPVRYIVPFGAGASPDIVARLLADKVSRLWGQQVVVENRVGVAGVMGTAYVAKSPPDGYTLLQCNIASSAIAMSLYAKVPYDQLREIAAVTRIGNMPNIITVHPSLPMRNLQEMIQYARSNPGKLSYSSGLVGTSPQLTVELIKLLGKVDILNVPYKVGAQAITDTIGGQVPLNCSNLPAIVNPVQNGRLRPLAVTSAERTPQMPDVQTVREAGFQGFEVQSWYGVCAPAETPDAILNKVNADFHSVLRTPEIQRRLAELGIDVAPTSREEFDQYIRSEITRWAQVIKDAGIVQQ